MSGDPQGLPSKPTAAELAALAALGRNCEWVTGVGGRGCCARPVGAAAAHAGRRGAPTWLKADAHLPEEHLPEEHLPEAHQATVDPSGT
ncbi:hypothetical protein [Streptomyces kaempferi]|uniref:Uncharacterized protein n=1 Tax=Streptomyces kaempferi TaxID=333725 RepID=A0ABW3XWD1_9ACTN